MPVALLVILPPHVVVPLRVKVVVPILSGAAAPMFIVPFTITLALRVFVPVPLVVKLLKVVAVAIVCAAPPKLTVPVPAVNNEPVPFHAVALVAFSLRVLDPPCNEPAVNVTTPVNVCVKADPKLRVPPGPFIVRPLLFILP